MKVDARGLACPMPVIKTKQAIDEHPQEPVEVRVDNPASKENVSRFLQTRGWQVKVEEKEGIFIITGTPGEIETDTSSFQSQEKEKRQKILVIIPTDKIGHGDDELGRALMKNFIATLKEMGDELWRLVLLNGGVKLAIEGSEHLEELRYLAEHGVDIFVCGTCLNFFGLLEKKAIGVTTNMLDIVTSMQLATKVICL
ncbi:MAG: sulfurtransferase-like selenium metabolism protein YedF [Candidatus Desulfofervidaceae bacterium]|nr:sulfurtransferase-like selenium metabolism protein YedF [Candidatus Desulfofervidaceae bacterium]